MSRFANLESKRSKLLSQSYTKPVLGFGLISQHIAAARRELPWQGNANGSRLGLDLFDCLGSIDPFRFDELKVKPNGSHVVKARLRFLLYRFS